MIECKSDFIPDVVLTEQNKKQEAIYRFDEDACPVVYGKVVQSPIVNLEKVESPIEYFGKSMSGERNNKKTESAHSMQMANKETTMLGFDTISIMQPYGNVKFKVLENICYIDHNGASSKDYENRLLIEIQPYFEVPGRTLGTMEIKYSEIPNLVKRAQAKFPMVIIEKEALKCRLPEEDIRLQIREAPVKVYYTDAGWQKINGQYVYLFKSTDRKVNVCCSRDLPFYPTWGKAELQNTWDALYGLYKERSVGIVLALYVFTGVTYSLFNEANFAWNSVLFLTGRTGSMKSSIAKVLAFQLMEEDARQQPRRIDQDTETSLEIALTRKGRDTITLYDDYCPAKTMRAKNRMADNFEKIVRMVGGRATKGRSNTNLEDCKGIGVHGSVIITGEVYGEGESSNLRCLYVPIVKELVDTDILSEFQSADFALTTLVKCFADYIGPQWDSWVNYIRHKFPELRRRTMQEHIFKYNRSVNRYVYFLLLAEMVKQFLKEGCGFDDSYLMEIFGESFHYDLVRVLSDSEESTEQSNPINNFLNAMVSLIARGELKLKAVRLESSDLELFDGYEDETYYYIQDSRLYGKVNAFLAATRTPFYSSLSEIKKMLADEGYIITHGNGQGKRTFCVRMKISGCSYKVDFLKFRKAKLVERLEDGTKGGGAE